MKFWSGWAAILLLGACSDYNESLVGGACRDDQDCDYDCKEGKDFPGGMCTVSCRNTSDCPDDTVCWDKDGGICAPLCRDNYDCRETYECTSRDLRGESGDARICVAR